MASKAVRLEHVSTNGYQCRLLKNLPLQVKLPNLQETPSPLEFKLQFACPSPSMKNPRRHPK